MSQAALLVRCAGPLQSYGDVARHTHLTTRMEPTKSALTGILCFATGRDLTEDISDFACMPMTVRVDKEGTVLRDFHVVRGVPRANEDTESTIKRHRKRLAKRGFPGGDPEMVSDVALLEEQRATVVTHRYYIQDAHFLVALEGELDFLQRIEDALLAPARIVSLGRKACLPGRPLWVKGGLIRDATGVDVLSKWTWERPRSSVDRLRLIRDLGRGAARGELRQDWPLSLHPEHRQFCSYRTETTWIETKNLSR